MAVVLLHKGARLGEVARNNLQPHGSLPINNLSAQYQMPSVTSCEHVGLPRLTQSSCASIDIA
jgi:hypothetical protein